MGYDAAAIAALGEDESRLPQIITRFVTYRETWFRRGTSAMLRAWSEGEAVAKRLLARSDGERRMTHLLHLGELLQQAAAIDPAPAALLRWLSARRQDERSDDSAQVRLESDRNLVQVVTIHKAKGLEYGVVFCPFLWDGRRPPSPTGDGKSYHDENGLPVIDFRAESEASSIRQQLDRECDAEFMRLLYVALTRAVHRCYLVVGCYQTLVGRHLSLSEGRRSLLNWLVAGHGIGYPAWRRNELSVDAIDGAWQRFAAQAAPAVSLADLPATPPQVLAVADLPTLPLAVPAPPGEGVADWRIGSFSSLQHGAMGDAAASDHDARLPAADVGVDGEASLTPEALSSDVAADDVLHFPRGAAAGDCVHALFERIDFTDRSDWPTRIADVLAAHHHLEQTRREGR
ncbi:MAG TPA: 3'-5' exonuclease, partial [Pirellulaceae bacterium]|nr:3'-5' exonuclease [Pirellulaceae bacterium]